MLSRNEATGQLGYHSVLAQYSNPYQETVYITVKDAQGNAQQIVSNKIHPFFTRVPLGQGLPTASEGHAYQGDITNANWVDASNLKAGYQLLSEDGKWQLITQVKQTHEALTAYNLTVETDHTYFIKGTGGSYGVWVHNKCWDDLPSSYKVADNKLQDGRELYTFTDSETGKTATVYQGADGRYYNYTDHKPTYKDGYSVSTTVGANNGNAISTEFVDASSNATIYQRVTPDGQAYSSYYYVDANGKQVNINSPRPRDSVIRQNNARHAAAVNDSVGQLRSQGITVTTEVTLKNADNLSETARIDSVIRGNNGAQVNVPSGYVATDLNGNVVNKIQLDSEGYAGIEVKTGGATLERNQGSVYNSCANGCAISVGTKASDVNLGGTTPTAIYILRPMEIK